MKPQSTRDAYFQQMRDRMQTRKKQAVVRRGAVRAVEAEKVANLSPGERRLIYSRIDTARDATFAIEFPNFMSELSDIYRILPRQVVSE